MAKIELSETLGALIVKMDGWLGRCCITGGCSSLEPLRCVRVSKLQWFELDNQKVTPSESLGDFGGWQIMPNFHSASVPLIA